MTTPSGFATVTPYFMAADADAFISFLIDGLVGTEIGRSVHDGRIANCQVTLGNGTVMVGQTRPGDAATLGHYYFYTDDADRAMERALAAGGEQIMPVADQPYGDRQGGVRDGEGNSWWISKRLTDEPYF